MIKQGNNKTTGNNSNRKNISITKTYCLWY